MKSFHLDLMELLSHLFSYDHMSYVLTSILQLSKSEANCCYVTSPSGRALIWALACTKIYMLFQE